MHLPNAGRAPHGRGPNTGEGATHARETPSDVPGRGVRRGLAARGIGHDRERRFAAVVRHAERGPDGCTTRRQLADPPGRQLPAHPVVRIRLHARRHPGAKQRADGRRGDRSVGARSRPVPRHDQRARHQPTAQGLPGLAEHPEDRAHRACSRAGDAREGRRRREGADLHPVGDPRERVRGSRRDVRPRRARRDDAVRHRPRGRRDPRPRRPLVERRPEPGRAHREPAREREQLRPESRLPDAVAVRDQGIGLDHAGVAAAGHARPARLRHADTDRVDDEAAQPEHRLRPLVEVEREPDRRERGGHERREPRRDAADPRLVRERRPAAGRAASAPTAIRQGLRRPKGGTTGARSTRRCTRSSSG